MLLLYFILAGVLLGLATGGRLSNLASVQFRWWPVALGGLAFQLLLFGPPLDRMVGDYGPALYVGSSALVLAALLRNLHQPGFALIAVGALLNLGVIVLNGGQMPASVEALAALNGVAELPAGQFTNSMLASNGTWLAWLGDVFVLPRPMPFANVFSIGDVLIGVGGAWFVVRTMHRSQDAARAGAVGAAG